MEETSKKVRHREIKFRCFYNGKMYPVLELHGEDSMTVNGIKMHLDGLGERVVSPDSEHIKGVMQYTGLKDKNGKEIYEGDILKYSYDDGLLLWVVESNNFGGYSIYNINRHSAAIRYPVDSPSYFIDREIIGNIFEHPHLLSQGEIKTELI